VIFICRSLQSLSCWAASYSDARGAATRNRSALLSPLEIWPRRSTEMSGGHCERHVLFAQQKIGNRRLVA
jgi:hypothetical protein